eukprot:TRINITY_DN13076_c0_g2_i1.p1 TRINITY_DN13076_c0_g2~~TRINITY_DN13076_c0_g2_i1.p1  ORF type:complete len:226 (+),score=36.17 TRINITY_DN13076_c0_g2_i1:59-736(+)
MCIRDRRRVHGELIELSQSSQRLFYALSHRNNMHREDTSWLQYLFNTFFVSIGVLFFVYHAVRLFQVFVLRRLQSRRDLLNIYGPNSWAVITGATSGIGKGFALALARTGFNICIIGRNQEKLRSVESEIKNQNNAIQVKTITIDLSKATDSAVIDALFSQIQDLDIGIFINNAGVFAKQSILKLAEEEVIELISTNCLAVVLCTKRVINLMRRRSSSRLSLIHI